MKQPQTLTEPATKTEEKAIGVIASTMATYGNSYIDFCAVQGMLTAEDGSIKMMTATEFARQIGVRRETLYLWQKRIPDFWDRVQARRKELGGNNRIMKVYNGLYLKAAAGNPQAAALWLANHDPDFRMPTQKLEHDLGSGLADILNAARARRDAAEGEVVDDKANT